MVAAVVSRRYFAEKHWLANNILGLAFSVQGIEHLSLGAVSTGVILLSGLFVYDIFWVFCTPVMVSVVSAPSHVLLPKMLPVMQHAPVLRVLHMKASRGLISNFATHTSCLYHYTALYQSHNKKAYMRHPCACYCSIMLNLPSSAYCFHCYTLNIQTVLLAAKAVAHASDA